MSGYITEFPDFGCMDVELPAGFIDTSWHNDAMPSFTKDLGGGKTLVLWIDYANPDEREFEFTERFCLSLIENEESVESHQSNEMQFIRLLAKVYALPDDVRAMLA